MKRPLLSMTTLAKIAKVHVATVSRALRHDPAIPETTRFRIQNLATKLGYRADPALAALCAYRKSRVVRSYKSTLAIITTTPDWQKNLADRLYYQGARRRAEELGYKTEVFVLAPPQLTGPRLAAVLTARNIRGLLVLPLSDVGMAPDFPWSDFSVVAIGYKLEVPDLNRVSVSHFDAMQNALNQVHALGYRRPGLVLRQESVRSAPTGTTRVGQIWEGGFRTTIQQRFPGVRIPVLRLDKAVSLARWLDRFRPDVIITQDRNLEHFLPKARAGFARVYTMVDDDARLTGIHQNSLHVGSYAVETLVGTMHRYETDRPPVPITILVQTRWQAGTTACAVQ